MAILLALRWGYEVHSSVVDLQGWVEVWMIAPFAIVVLFGGRLPRSAAVLIAAASLWVELAFVITGQMTSLGPMATWYGAAQAYRPNLAEVAILVLGIAVAADRPWESQLDWTRVRRAAAATGWAALTGVALSVGLAGGARGYLMNGQLSNQAAVQRSKDVHDIIGIDMCNFMELIDEQTANWSRDEAADLMTNWLSAGEEFHFVLANNDEMAIGAIQAMKAAGIDMADIQVGGVDASQDALVAMQAGDYDVTVFQDAFGQGAGSVDTAIALANGETVDQKVYIPFVLVTPSNMADFLDKN